jgi:hypothetical protein
MSIIWSLVLCTLLMWSDWKRVGLGMLAAIILGFVISATIPSQHRGKLNREVTTERITPSRNRTSKSVGRVWLSPT